MKKQRPRLPGTEIRNLAAQLVELGWDWHYTGGGHLKFTHPAGHVVFTSSTPGDRKALQQIRSQFRRLGTPL